ncbi:MAG: hypothetical protein WAN36_01015 [Calditrichia bacterium]
MYKFNIVLVLFAASLFFVVGCQNANSPTMPSANALDNSASGQSFSKVGKGGMIWADCELFGTIGTPAHFKPGHGPFDNLYQGAFKDGVGAISESKPGDQDFNGGRWHVFVLKAGVTTDYSNACSVADLDLNDFEPTMTYFECPLLPRRGHN